MKISPFITRKTVDKLPAAIGPGVPIGGQIACAQIDDFTTPDGAVFLQADGRLVDRSTYSKFYISQGSGAHRYNLGVDPGANKVKIPDKRGRISVGPDHMAGTRIAGFTNPGAAGRLTTAKGHNNDVGQNGGLERHQLLAAETGVNGNGSVGSVGDHNHPQNGHGGVPFDGSAGAGPPFAIYGSGTVGFGAHMGYAGSHGHGFNSRNADNEHNNVQPYEVDTIFVRVA